MFVIATVGTISTGAVDSLSLVRIREPRGDEGGGGIARGKVAYTTLDWPSLQETQCLAACRWFKRRYLFLNSFSK